MRQLRIAGITFLVLAMSALVFFPGVPASGQSAPEIPRQGNPTYYQNNFIPYSSGTWFLEHGAQDPAMKKLLNEEGKLEREVAGLRRDYVRIENDAERAKIKAKLADLLSKQFDVQQNRRDVELTRLEAQVKKLRELMKKRTETKQTIVDRHLDQLIREAEGLGWTAPPGFTPKANLEPSLR
jgi:hypothetical protein